MISCTANNDYIEADKSLDRLLPFQCPECMGPLTLKAGDVKIAHFAHKTDTGCRHGVGETEWHRTAKVWTAKFLRQKGWSVNLEHKLSNRRTDLYATAPKGFRACFEFQRKDEGSEIYNRTRDLAAHCDEVVWVLPFDCEYISKSWRITQTYAINALFSKEKRPHKSAVLFFRDWSPNLYECEKHDWVLDVQEYNGDGGYSKVAKRWCQLEIKSIYGGKYSKDLRGAI
jgi:competence CoiA-like predicted nuclease